MAVSSSPGCRTCHAGDVDVRADEVVLGIHHALALRAADDHLGIKRNHGRGGVGRADRHATVGAQDGVLAIDGRRRIRIADIAAGAIAGPTAAVIPATRVLRDVAADRALVADLRRGGRFSGLASECRTSA